MRILILLSLTLYSCSLWDQAFGPYDKNSYCSGITLSEMQKGDLNQENPKKSNHEKMMSFFLSKEEDLNRCFKLFTVDRVEKRHYCVVMRVTKKGNRNKIRYLAIDNMRQGVSTQLRDCLETEINRIKKHDLGSFQRLTLHYALKLEK
jgi:hypothetical protein